MWRCVLLGAQDGREREEGEAEYMGAMERSPRAFSSSCCSRVSLWLYWRRTLLAKNASERLLLRTTGVRKGSFWSMMSRTERRSRHCRGGSQSWRRMCLQRS